MKRTFDNYTSNQLPANHQSSNNESYMVRNIINNQRSYFATLINEENFGHLIYELNNNPEYVYKCILDYGRNNNNSQYTKTLDYLLSTYKGHYHAISQMINWSLEDGSISTFNYMIDSILRTTTFEDFFTSLLPTQPRETIVNILTYCFSSETSLCLIENEIEGKDFKIIAEALKHNSTITSLDLACSNIGVEESKYLAEALKHNSTLTSLDLESNNIGDEGVKFLAEALKCNSTLTSLYLGGNNISNEGVKVLAEAFKHNSTLVSLDLGHIEMTDSLELTASKNLLIFNDEKTALSTKAENAVKCLKKFAVYDATKNSTPELGSQENWQELKKAVKMYLSKPQAIKFVAREKDLSVGETTAITHAAKYRKAAALDDDILACLYFDDSDNQLPWEIVELIGSFYATSLSD